MAEGSPSVESDGSGPGDRLVRAVAVPLVLVALAYGLWMVSDRLGYVGPLDKATFGWSVVIPLWLATPVVAASSWRSLSDSGCDRAALATGILVAAAGTILLFQAVAYPDCATGALPEPIGWLVPSALVGLAIGGGLSFSTLAASGSARQGRVWRAVVLGGGVQLAMVFLAILVAAAFLIGPACQRPHA